MFRLLSFQALRLLFVLVLSLYYQDKLIDPYDDPPAVPTDVGMFEADSTDILDLIDPLVLTVNPFAITAHTSLAVFQTVHLIPSGWEVFMADKDVRSWFSLNRC